MIEAMKDMEEADSMDNLLPSGETSSGKEGLMESEQPRPEGEDTAMIDHLELSGGNGEPGISSSENTAKVQESKVDHERDRTVRKGSAGSHRSRHNSGGSSSSSTRRRNRSRNRHTSKNGDMMGDETQQQKSTSGTRSNSASSRRSHTNHQKSKTVMNADQDNTTSTDDDDGPACSVVHIDSFTLEDGDERPVSASYKGDMGRDDKMIAKMGKSLLVEKQKYVSEKQLLKEKMEIARKQFEQEITKYEQELDGKRQEIQIQLSDLRVDEQYNTLSQRMEELAGFREVLDSRFMQCVEYEKEIEEIERYLDRRQQLCNSKEEDLRLLDDQLDTLHQELELDKERLERAGFDAKNMAPRNRSTSFRSPQKNMESDADEYILKANLRKCQSDLKRAEQAVHERDVELGRAREEISSLQSDKRKHKEKIKQLETQLSVALSQLKNQTNATHSSSITLNRHASARSHVTLDRLKSQADLSINQQAQLNRSLSRKDKGGLSPAGKKYPSSGSNSKSDGEHSKGSSSDGDTSLYFQGRPRSSTEGSVQSQPRTVSSTCAVM